MAKYAIVLVDQFSGYIALRCVRVLGSGNIVRAIEDILTTDELLSKVQVRAIQTDADTIFKSKLFKAMLEKHGIRGEIVSVQSSKTSLC